MAWICICRYTVGLSCASVVDIHIYTSIELNCAREEGRGGEEVTDGWERGGWGRGGVRNGWERGEVRGGQS